MEKRVLMAAVLSAVVVVVWFAVLAPPPSARRGDGPSSTPPPATAGVPKDVPPATGKAPRPTVAVREAEIGVAAQEVELEGVGSRVVLTNRGGVVRSLQLREYHQADGSPQELVREGDVRPLAMVAAGPWNSDLYAVARVGNSAVLRWSDGLGNWVEKRVAAAKSRFGFEVEVRSGGEPAKGGVVVGQTFAEGQEDYGQFRIQNAIVRAAGKLTRTAASKVEKETVVGGPIDFAGVEDRYFVLALLPDQGVDEARVRRVARESSVAGGQRAEAGKEGVEDKGGAGKGSSVAEVSVGDRDGGVRGTLFAGAKEHRLLQGYGRGLDETVSFGFFGILSVGFLAALRWIYGWAGNWGVAIILLTAGIRILLFPLNHKSAVAMKRMQVLQPKMKAIQDRYQDRAKKDIQVRNRMNQEVMQLYKQEGVNPMGGCLPLLVQMPILWALYTLFGYAIELRQAPFVFWIHDLSIKDPTYITPLLMTATMVLQQRLTPQVGDPAQRRMFMLMPFIFGFMFMSFPAGLVLYWLINNLFTIGQQMLTNRLLANAAPAK